MKNSLDPRKTIKIEDKYIWYIEKGYNYCHISKIINWFKSLGDK